MGRKLREAKMERFMQILVLIAVFIIAHSISAAPDDSSTNDVSVKRDDSEIYDGPYYSDDYLHMFGNPRGNIHTYVRGVGHNNNGRYGYGNIYASKNNGKQWNRLLKAVTSLHGYKPKRKRKRRTRKAKRRQRRRK